MNVGTNHEHMQAYNQRLILETIRLQGPIPRAAIARLTGLTAPTVSRIVNDLVGNELVLEKRRQGGKLGKPAVDLTLNPGGAYSIGFNFDRDQLSGVLVDLSGRVIHRVHHRVDEIAPAAAISLMQKATSEFMARPEISRERVLGIGVGIPGPLHISPVPSSLLFQLPGWEGVNVLDVLSNSLALPVYLENNPVAAAIGEVWYGEGRSIDNFYFIFFGLYLGGCAVINRQPNRGAGGFAAEFGSIPFEKDDAYPDGIRRLGHRVSLAALFERLEQHGIDARTPDELELLYAASDPHLLAWLDEALEFLLPELWRIECLFDPEAIVFGERLPESMVEHLTSRLEVRLADFRMSYKPSGPRLLRGWAGEDAASLGAAALPIYHALLPSPSLIMSQSKRETLDLAGVGGGGPA